MQYLYKLSLLIFLIPAVSFAQSNFKPGYVVSLKGDTASGFIDYKEWIRNPTKVIFKNDLNAESNTYSTQNSSAFGVTGMEYYRRFIVSVSQDKVQLSNLTTGADTTSIVDTVFLKTVTSGKALTLFTYSDDIKRRFFVAENGENARELIRRFYLDPQDGSRVTVKTYTRQLLLLAAKYQPEDKKLANQINAAEYSGKDLAQIVNNFNGSESKMSEQPAKQKGFRLFIGAALNHSTSEFSNDEVQNLKSSSASPQISIGGDLFVNKNVGRLLFRFELGFTSNKPTFTYNGEEANATTTTVYKYNQFNAFFNPQLLYNLYNSEKTKVYVAGGVQLNYAAYSGESSITTFYTSFGGGSEYINTVPDLRPFYINVTTKIGCVINNKVEVFAGYSPYTSVGFSAITAYRFGINYLFGKK